MNNQEIYNQFLKLDPILAEKFKEENIKPKKELKIPWPIKNKWWSNKRFNKVKKRYKPLEAILVEVMSFTNWIDHKEAIICCDSEGNKSAEFYKKHNFLLKGKDKNTYKTPALLKLNCKILIAKNVGISVRSMEDYLRALVRIGALRVDNFGDGKIYYSAGYWTEYREEDVWKNKVQPFMTFAISRKLTDINQFYLKKPK